MSSDTKRLVQLLLEKSVRFGSFTLASGKTSDFYVDARQTTLSHEGAPLIAKMILERLHPEAQAVGGPVTGADPITGAVVAASAGAGRPVHGFMVRKAAKGYGGGNLVEGQHNLPAGSAVCVLEDTVTTGGSVLKAIGHLEALGLRVVQVLVVVDREEGAAERFRQAGYTLESLVGRRDLEAGR